MNQPVNQPPRDFDQLLDRALSRYAPPEPRPGLEQRILAQLHATSKPALASPPKSLWLWKSAAFATLAIAILLVVVARSNKRPAPRPAVQEFAIEKPAPSPLRAGKMPALPTPLARRYYHPAAHPTPYAPAVKLTPQERLLVNFALHHPDHLRALTQPGLTLAQPRREPLPQTETKAEPIQLHALFVTPIEIRPIDTTVKEPPSF